MSVVTFVRDYIQDPDKIVSVPSFVLSACKEFFWYIFSFQWFRNLTYITLSFLNKSVPVDGAGTTTENLASTDLANVLNQKSALAAVTDSHSLLNTSFESHLNLPNQFSFFQDVFSGSFNGISSTFHFCAVTILVLNVLLNENKNNAFKLTLASCFGDVSYIGAILFGFRGLIVPWLVLEPLSYVSGFVIQFFFALQIIKDNRKIKTKSKSNQLTKGEALTANDFRFSSGWSDKSFYGELSSHRWIVPSLILFSWCEQTQFFQTGGVLSLQPTATLLDMSGLVSNNLNELHIIVYLFSFVSTRVIFTWFCLSLCQSLIDWFNFHFVTGFGFKNIVTLLNPSTKNRKAVFTNLVERVWSSGRKTVTSLFSNIIHWILPKNFQNTSAAQDDVVGFVSQPDGRAVSIKPRGNSIQHILGDKLAIAAVTCSLAFLPAYSTNLLLTKSVGFFPEENRVSHSFVSPWDMPSTVLASDTNFLRMNPNPTEYPLFLPFYDFGNYNGSLGIGEEDIRYGPFRLWYSRRMRAPWRRTTLQEPALTFVNDKSLFINPKFRTPILSEKSLKNKEETANLKEGTNLVPRLIELIEGVPRAGTRKNSTLLRNTLGSSKVQMKGYTPQDERTALAALLSIRAPTTSEIGSGKSSPSTLLTLLRNPHSQSTENEIKEKILIASNSKINKIGAKKLIDRLKRPLRKIRFSKFLNQHQVSLDQAWFSEKEKQLRNNRQTKNRLKRFKRKLSFLPPRARKERRKKIKETKHFRYLKNKNKRLKKFHRLIYKLREQYFSMRNIKKRKQNLNTYELPVGQPYGQSNQNVPKAAKVSEGTFLAQGFLKNDVDSPWDKDEKDLEASSNQKLQELTIQNPTHPSTEYPKKKNSTNAQQDFNLIFCSQMGEGLDFSQEEVRARIFVSPYIRFLLNNRIDTLLSRSITSAPIDGVTKPLHQKQVQSQVVPSSVLSQSVSTIVGKTNKTAKAAKAAKAENDLFRRRLMVAKYADTINLLKPSLRYSFVDKVYNHQFKGTLSTARRLFSLRVQFDEPLVNSENYKPAIWHEGLVTEKPEQPFLEKGYSAPLYAAWAPQARKLILTNRYLDYKTATTSALVDNKLQIPNKRNIIQFTHWPMNESYSTNNEFFISQLYPKTQPGESFLSQRYENISTAALPRRVTSFNTPVSSKNPTQPTAAQRSQQFFDMEQNDKKTFSFKNFWNSSNTANELTDKNVLNSSPVAAAQKSHTPASAEQGKGTGMEEWEYPLWTLLRALPPNQGGFLWPGD